MTRLLLFCLSVGLLWSAPTRVLFIGNSYTYYNSLPQMVEELAQAAGQDMEFRAFTRGGATLLELELHPELRSLLNEKWDYVVLQEHSTQGFSAWNGELNVNDPIYFLQGARLIAQRVNKAKIVLYSTWARKNHPEFQPHLDYGYMLASRELNAAIAPAAIAPVGRAWAAVREQPSAPELFVADGSHPTPAGSYLSACVLIRTLFSRPCTGLPATLRGNIINTRGQREEGREIELINLKPDVAAMLQRAADEAVADPGSPAPSLTSHASPNGRRPKNDELAGRWKGRVFFYGTPATFDLEVKADKSEGDKCSGVWRLNADNGSWSSARRFATCHLTDQGFVFTITEPTGAAVEHHAVAFSNKELNAVTLLDYRTAMRRGGGTWTARPEATRTSSSR